MENRGARRWATRGMLSSRLMTMVYPSGRIRPNYLFICISTASDKKKSGCLRIDGGYLRSGTSGNE